MKTSTAAQKFALHVVRLLEKDGFVCIAEHGEDDAIHFQASHPFGGAAAIRRVGQVSGDGSNALGPSGSPNTPYDVAYDLRRRLRKGVEL